VVQVKVKSSTVCRRELCAVSASEIEDAERVLMEGLNYQFRCHHPDPATRALSSEIFEFLSSKQYTGDRPGECFASETELLEKAFEITRRVLVFSDAPFLFPPGHIAFAIVAFALKSVDSTGRMKQLMHDFLRSRFPDKSVEERRDFSDHVHKVVRELLACPYMQVNPVASMSHTADNNIKVVTQKCSEELRGVLKKVGSLRLLRRMYLQSARAGACSFSSSRKRSRTELSDFTPPRKRQQQLLLPPCSSKYTRVTPTTSQC